MPKKLAMRSMFVASKGNVLLAFDLSQAETWVVAHKANEQNMMFALKYGDIHSTTAVAIFHEQYSNCQHTKWKKHPDESRTCPLCGCTITKNERYTGKRCNHASSYRMKYPRMAEVINKDASETGVYVTTYDAKKYQHKWHQFYILRHWWDEIDVKLKTTRTMTTVYGRKRVFFGHMNDELLKEGTAYEPQATVADHALGAIQPEVGIPGGVLSISRHFKGTDVKLVHSAHDSITLDCPVRVQDEVAQICYNYMHRPLVINDMEFTIPVDAEVGDRWGELEPLKLAA